MQSSFSDEGLSFIARCAAEPAAAAADDFLATLKQFGFAGAAGGAWAGVGKNRHTRFFFVHWPPEWLKLYMEFGGPENDPFPTESRRRMAPFTWTEISQSKLTAAQRALVDAGYAFGWREVIGVPIHGPGSLQGLVTMGTTHECSFTAVEFGVLEGMARAVWNCCRGAEGFGLVTEPVPRLSARELECLQWAAAGKSDTDIGTLLGISGATAHFHVERAKKRLGVTTRVEAVAVAVLQGLI